MKRTTLDLLACPTRHGELSLQAASGNSLIETGSLSCPTCQKIFPIQQGLPHFIQENELV